MHHSGLCVHVCVRFMVFSDKSNQVIPKRFFNVGWFWLMHVESGFEYQKCVVAWLCGTKRPFYRVRATITGPNSGLLPSAAQSDQSRGMVFELEAK